MHGRRTRRCPDGDDGYSGRRDRNFTPHVAHSMNCAMCCET
jgi:hypothetical protein